MEVTPARRDDVVAMAGLLEEMDRFYGVAGAGQLEDRVCEISEALFTDPPAAYALVAWDQAQLAGMAAYSFVWPAAGLSRSLYLKELFVGEACRRRGVGKLLMRALFQEAAEHRCSRVEWTTDSGNIGAQAFYEALVPAQRPAKVFYRVQAASEGFPSLR